MNRLKSVLIFPIVGLLVGLFMSSCTKTGGSEKKHLVIIIGSSIARGEGASAYDKSWAGKLSANNPTAKFENLAVGSSTTYHFLPFSYTNYCTSIHRPIPLTDINTSNLIQKRPDFVIISFTTNDVMNGFDPSEYLKNIQIITDSLEKSKIPYLVTSNGITGLFTEKQKKDSKFIFSVLPVIYGRGFIDIMTPLVDTSKMQLNQDLFISDKTHPNDEGHNSLFLKIDSAYKKLLN